MLALMILPSACEAAVENSAAAPSESAEGDELDDPQAEADGEPAPAEGEAPAQAQASRNDVVASLIPPGGPWGAWKTPKFCNDGDYATGFEMRVEPHIDGDDTALNSVRLICQSKSGGNWYKITSHPGVWGNWGPTAICKYIPHDWLVAARLKVEIPQGKGDDTAANAVQFWCSQSGQLSPGNGGPWGNWNAWHQCPAKSAICGLSIRFEDPIGSGDDTAMNGIKLWCCSL